MEEKTVVASMSNEMVLSIEDLKREGSRKLPAFKRGKLSLHIFLKEYVSSSDASERQILINDQSRILQLGFNLSGNSP
jgi:hypothetical protein